MFQIINEHGFLILWILIAIPTINGVLGDFWEVIGPVKMQFGWLLNSSLLMIAMAVLTFVTAPILALTFICEGKLNKKDYKSFISIRHLKLLLLFSPVLCLFLLWMVE